MRTSLRSFRSSINPVSVGPGQFRGRHSAELENHEHETAFWLLHLRLQFTTTGRMLTSSSSGVTVMTNQYSRLIFTQRNNTSTPPNKITMVWKALKEKSGITKHSSTGSHSSTFSVNMGKLPKKSCLRTAEDSLDSDWSNGGSSVSSQRSETVKCESSFISVPANSTISTRMSTHATESLDANVSKVSRVIEAPTMETTTRSTGSNTTYSEKCKSVRFSVVEIRDYAREVADNPSCSSGPPIG